MTEVVYSFPATHTTGGGCWPGLDNCVWNTVALGWDTSDHGSANHQTNVQGHLGWADTAAHNWGKKFLHWRVLLLMQLKPLCWRCNPQWSSVAGCRWLAGHPSGSNCAVPPQPKERTSLLPASSPASALPCRQTHVAASSWDDQRACNRKLYLSMVQYNYIMYLRVHQSAESNRRRGSRKAWMALIKNASATFWLRTCTASFTFTLRRCYSSMCAAVSLLAKRNPSFVWRLCSSLMWLQEITSPSLFFMACFASVLRANFTMWALFIMQYTTAWSIAAIRAGCGDRWVSLLATSAVPTESEIINDGKDSDLGKWRTDTLRERGVWNYNKTRIKIQ